MLRGLQRGFQQIDLHIFQKASILKFWEYNVRMKTVVIIQQVIQNTHNPTDLDI